MATTGLTISIEGRNKGEDVNSLGTWEVTWHSTDGAWEISRPE